MPRPSLEGTRLHLVMTKQQAREMQRLSAETGLSISELLRRAIDAFLAARRSVR